jgi:lipopolysaccharide/colanic/teichoic acid biosynthesis glycosyltransferase
VSNLLQPGFQGFLCCNRRVDWPRDYGKRLRGLMIVTLEAMPGTVLGIVSILAKLLGDGGSALFSRGRIGSSGQQLVLLKLWAMTRSSRVESRLACSPYLTPIGQLPCTPSVDELPQLVSAVESAVLRGTR